MKAAVLTLTPVAVLVMVAIFTWALVPTALMPEYPEGRDRTQSAHVLAASLVKAQERNSTRFETEYAGDEVRTHGRIRRIHENGLVEMKGRWGYKLFCTFGTREEAARLDPGNRVTLHGEIEGARRTGKTTGEARLGQCRGKVQ